MNISYDYSKDPFPLNTSIRLFDKTKFVRLLKEEGIDLNQLDEFGETPLTTAIMEDIADIRWVRILLKRGAEVNVLDSDGDSALDLARFKHREDLIELLLKYGAKGKDEDSVKRKNLDAYYDDMKVANFVKSLSRYDSN